MKTAEEKKAEREARLIANVSGPRTGYTPETTAELPAPSPVIQGLKLSDVQLWPLERFKPHPSNHVFDSAKTETYWRDLRRDILEAGAIINPVIALPDGTLLEGHSRLRIAGELAAEGRDLGRIPVRVVSSPITSEEAERRVYLGNLSRFEIDQDTRAVLYAKIWPDLTREAKPGPASSAEKGVTETVSVTSAVKELAASAGISERQAWNEKRVLEGAEAQRKAEGAENLAQEHVQKARAKVNALRREKTRAPARRPGRVILELSRVHVELVLGMLRKVKAPSDMQTRIIREIERALKR